MTKYVTETKAGQAVSAFIILNKKGKQVGKVHAHYANSGKVTVDVWDYSLDESLQQGSASGYGYDKFSAALAGCTIDGVALFDNCGRDAKLEKILAAFSKLDNNAENRATFDKKVIKLGARFANGYKSLYYQAALDRLDCMGYQVIQAI